MGPAIAGVLFDIHIDLPYICGAFIILASLILSLLSKAGELGHWGEGRLCEKSPDK